MSTSLDPSSPTIPLTESQIIFVAGLGGAPTSWRSRLAPLRRWLFAASIALGSAAGAGLFFATHDAPVSLESAAQAIPAAPAPAAAPAAPPAVAEPSVAATPAEPEQARPQKRPARKKRPRGETARRR